MVLQDPLAPQRTIPETGPAWLARYTTPRLKQLRFLSPFIKGLGFFWVFVATLPIVGFFLYLGAEGWYPELLYPVPPISLHAACFFFRNRVIYWLGIITHLTFIVYLFIVGSWFIQIFFIVSLPIYWRAGPLFGPHHIQEIHDELLRRSILDP